VIERACSAIVSSRCQSKEPYIVVGRHMSDMYMYKYMSVNLTLLYYYVILARVKTINQTSKKMCLKMIF